MSSLDKSLSDVSDKEGLTDDELQERLNSLRTVTADVPAEVSAHLTAYKRGISQSVVSATFDTRTEAGLAGRSGLALNKVDTHDHDRSFRALIPYTPLYLVPYTPLYLILYTFYLIPPYILFHHPTNNLSILL